MSAVAVLSSGVGTATDMFKLKEDLQAMLRSGDFLTAVAKRQGSVANMKKPGSHLIDEAMKMGTKIVSVDLNQGCAS